MAFKNTRNLESVQGTAWQALTLDNWIDGSTTRETYFAIKNDGTLWAWGDNTRNVMLLLRKYLNGGKNI